MGGRGRREREEGGEGGGRGRKEEGEEEVGGRKGWREGGREGERECGMGKHENDYT